MNTSDKTPPEFSLWRGLFLIFSVFLDLFLVNICFGYYHILTHPLIMGSLVDSRGGFYEMHTMVPLLAMSVVITAGIGGANSKALKRWATGLALVGIGLWFGLWILVYFIRTSLR